MNKEQLLKKIGEIIKLHGNKTFSFYIITLKEYREYKTFYGLFETYENASICFREIDNKLWIERGNKRIKQLKNFPMYHLERFYKQIEKWLDEKYKWREKT